MAPITAKKSVFEMSPEEIRDHLKPTAQQLKQTALDNGAWYSYTNERCIEPER